MTIDPGEVVILINSSDPTSLMTAELYRREWNIPERNIVVAKLGRRDDLESGDLIESAKAAISKLEARFIILAFKMPSRYQSVNPITWVLRVKEMNLFMIPSMDHIADPDRLSAVDLVTGEQRSYEAGGPAIVSWWDQEKNPERTLFTGDGLCSSGG